MELNTEGWGNTGMSQDGGGMGRVGAILSVIPTPVTQGIGTMLNIGQKIKNKNVAGAAMDIKNLAGGADDVGKEISSAQTELGAI